MTAYAPHPARTFFAILLGGMSLLAIVRLEQAGSDPSLVRIIAGTNTAGIFFSALVAAIWKNPSFPIFPKVMVTHIMAACLFGYLTATQRGLGVAIGSSFPISIISAGLGWMMLSRKWIIGDVIFWGLVALYVIGIPAFFL